MGSVVCKCKSICVHLAEAGFLRAKCSQVTTPTRPRAIADGGGFDRNIATRAAFPAEGCKKPPKTKPPRTSLDKQEVGRTVLKERLGENSSLIVAGQRLERRQRWGGKRGRASAVAGRAALCSGSRSRRASRCCRTPNIISSYQGDLLEDSSIDKTEIIFKEQ